MTETLITNISALVLCGGGRALFWKPFIAEISSSVTNNRASGDIISGYKEQVLLQCENNELFRKENDWLHDRHDKNIRRFSILETYLRLIKNDLEILLTMSENALDMSGDNSFGNGVTRRLATLEDDNDVRNPL